MLSYSLHTQQHVESHWLPTSLPYLSLQLEQSCVFRCSSSLHRCCIRIGKRPYQISFVKYCVKGIGGEQSRPARARLLSHLIPSLMFTLQLLGEVGDPDDAYVQ